jgi:hypothetical protein
MRFSATKTTAINSLTKKPGSMGSPAFKLPWKLQNYGRAATPVVASALNHVAASV